MTKPIIAAVDPRRDDLAPAALAAQLARVLEAPVVLAAAYPVTLSIENLHPEYARALGRVADGGLDRLATQLDEPGITVRQAAVPSTGSPARALHALARDEHAQLLVIGSSVPCAGAHGGVPGARGPQRIQIDNREPVALAERRTRR